jgi:Uncharacterized conserved protein (DUF2304)
MIHDILPLPIQLLSLGALASLLGWVLRLVRSNRLPLRESLPWVLSTMGALLVTAFPGLLVAAAGHVGVQVPSNALFGAAIVYLLANVLHLTVTASQTAQRSRRLAQECALLRAELDALRERAGVGPDR